AEMPFLQQVHEEKSGEVVLLAVNFGGSQSEVEGFMENLDLSFLTVLDTDERMAQQYNIRIIPTTFFIDREGVIQDIKIGAFASESEIIAQLDKAIP
ncbi:MAG: TlpA disulfide reductase family protein, partial [Dehalococcoidales bacterium]|nr:TlpA disulfide reductase family protein [Dehalococcoidales bacterium]